MDADTHAIERLKYRYVRLLDTKQWNEFADCFAPEATSDYAGLRFEEPGALVDYLRANLVEGIVTMHHVHHPEITIEDTDHARGRWYLHDKVFAAEFGVALEGAAFYEDRYVRTDAGWRIAHTGYERTWELTWKLDELPGAKLRLPERA